MENNLIQINKQKAEIIISLANQFGIDILIETGTYKGDMISSCLNNFKNIYSIELDEKLALAAQERFKDNAHVKIIHGDSANILQFVISPIQEPVIFWLDAHYSGGETTRGEQDTSIIQELGQIFMSGRKDDVILIDDLHMFKTPNYPHLVNLFNGINTFLPRYIVSINYNMIMAYPGE